jgi:hypothetical protein
VLSLMWSPVRMGNDVGERWGGHVIVLHCVEDASFVCTQMQPAGIRSSLLLGSKLEKDGVGILLGQSLNHAQQTLTRAGDRLR